MHSSLSASLSLLFSPPPCPSFCPYPYILLSLPNFLFFFSLAFLWQEVGPPRPPLPKSYQPLESSQSFPPSVPPLPLDSYAWLRSMGPHSGIHQEGYKDDEEFRSRKVPQRGGPHYENVTPWSFLQHQQHLSFSSGLINFITSLSFHFTISLHVCFYIFMIFSYITLSQTKRHHNITSVVRYSKYWYK